MLTIICAIVHYRVCARSRSDRSHLGSILSSRVFPVEVDPPVGDHERWLAQLTGKRSILMVGTLEPRKGHADAVSAFEKLWDEGSTLQLIICGKEGWVLDDLSTRIRQHPEFGKRLFWFEGASDHTLRKLYQEPQWSPCRFRIGCPCTFMTRARRPGQGGWRVVQRHENGFVRALALC